MAKIRLFEGHYPKTRAPGLARAEGRKDTTNRTTAQRAERDGKALRLLLEKILESLACIVGARRSLRSGSDLGGLSVRGRRGVFFNGHTEFVELAIILGVFRGDPLGDGLGTFELGAGIEEAALFATVQFELALGTFAVGVETRSQNSTAIGAAAARDRAHHARSARAELVRAWTALRGLAIVPLFSLFAFFRVAISTVSVLSIHKRLHPGTMPDCDLNCPNFRVDTHSNRGMYPNGKLHSAHSAIVTQRFRTGLATSKQEMGQLCF